MLTKEKEILLNVIEMYKDMPYLWDKKNKNYRNQELRKEGNKILFEIYKEYDANANIRTLIKKVQNLRTTFFKELKKVKRSIRAGAERVYEPTLWYFDAMSFLASNRVCRDDNETENTNDHEGISRNSDLQTSEYDDNSSTSSHRNDPIHVIPMNSKRRLKKVAKKEIDELLSMARENKITREMTREDENECELFGQLLARKLKKIDEDQRLILMNEIDNLVFKATMSTKDRTSYFTMVESNMDTGEV